MRASGFFRRGILIPAGLAAVAWMLLVGSRARAEADTPPAGVVRRAELDGPDLRLCVEREDRFETLSVDTEDPHAPLLSEAGCGDFGSGQPLPIRDREAPDSVSIDGSSAVYVDGDGDVLRIPLDLVADDADDPPYERSSEPEPEDPCAGDRCIQRVPTRRGSSRIVLPGPRAGEIGEATRDATLGGLEQTLDPLIEPPLALTLRGVSAAVGFAVGAALYVPTTLLDVVETEYGVDEYGSDPDEAAVECDPYEPYDRYEWHGPCD